MIFTTVLQWSCNGASSIASKNDLDDQNLLLATVRHFDILCINKLCQIGEDAYLYATITLKSRTTNNNITNL
jgi:hypothetical protein